MNYEEFTLEIKREVQETFGEDYLVDCEKIIKNNSTKLVGLMIRKNGSIISPTIYLEDFYAMYKKGMTIGKLKERILTIYENACQRIENDYDTPFCMEFKNCRDRIVYRLVSKKKNQIILENTPYVPFLNLAVIFYIVYRSSDKGLESIRVTHELMRRWEVTTEELVQYAGENTKHWFPERTADMTEVVSAFMQKNKPKTVDEAISSKLLILSNTSGINGASVLLYDNVIKELAEKFASDLYILPSSIHEVLLLPVNSGADVENLKKTVRHVNEVAVSKEDYLSDNVYIYRRKTNSFEYE